MTRIIFLEDESAIREVITVYSVFFADTGAFDLSVPDRYLFICPSILGEEKIHLLDEPDHRLNKI